jgi:hypothetical protein
MNHSATPITDYDSAPFSATCSTGQTISHDVYRRGCGAPIIIIQELPGAPIWPTGESQYRRQSSARVLYAQGIQLV